MDKGIFTSNKNYEMPNEISHSSSKNDYIGCSKKVKFLDLHEG